MKRLSLFTLACVVGLLSGCRSTLDVRPGTLDDPAPSPSQADAGLASPLTPAERRALTPTALQALTQAEVDRLYARLTAGPIPDGPQQGDVFFPRGSNGRARLRDVATMPAGPFAHLATLRIEQLARGLWRGKVFYKSEGILRNRIEELTLLKLMIRDDESLPTFTSGGQTTWLLFPAMVACGDSLFDRRRESIVIDYSRGEDIDGYRPVPDRLAGPAGLNVRDEIRMVRPGFYLGRVYFGGRFGLNFTLFDPAIANAGDAVDRPALEECDVSTRTPPMVADNAIHTRPDVHADGAGYEAGGDGLTENERRGRDTWHFWTAGNQTFWRRAVLITEGNLDMLMYIDSRIRHRRFQTLGVLNHPGCKAAAGPDQYGLWIDDCSGAEPVERIPGVPTGVVGLRRFPNPDFVASNWRVDAYLKDRRIEPPYLVGMSCGFCHIGFNPIVPPKDVENPIWANLAPTIGNQYFEEGKFFIQNMGPDDFRWHVGNRQPPGTSDTSRVATDHINNANTINALFNLKFRRAYPERMPDGTTLDVPRVLKDGADSRGLALASMRVFVNIGMCGDYAITRHDAVMGMGPQRPFEIDYARANCQEWRDTEARMPDMLAFLTTLTPLRVRDAPGGAAYLPESEEELRRGKLAFAGNCVPCHSSKQPAPESRDQRQAFRDLVLAPDFLDGNFLSDDQRYSVRRIGTNVARAAGTNAGRGHIWEQFSSDTYKEQPAVGTIGGLFNPRDVRETLTVELKAGGGGYYRPPSLVGVWATAPYLHNNSVGTYIKDPSVDGRMTAFLDGIRKLLWPELRLGVQSIPVTSRPSSLRLASGHVLNVPAGVPIDLIARIDPNMMPNLLRKRMVQDLIGDPVLYRLMEGNNLVPDYVADRGHLFGTTLPDADKWALMAFLKTF